MIKGQALFCIHRSNRYAQEFPTIIPSHKKAKVGKPSPTFFQGGWPHQGFPAARQKGSNPRRSAKHPKMCTICTWERNAMVLDFIPIRFKAFSLLIESVDEITIDVRGKRVTGFVLFLFLLLVSFLSVLDKVDSLLWGHICLVVVVFIVFPWPNWRFLSSHEDLTFPDVIIFVVFLVWRLFRGIW